METIKKLWFERERIYIETNAGHSFSRPLEAFPVLKHSSDAERRDFVIGSDGTDVRWKAIDEDIHIHSIFNTEEPDAGNPIAKALKQFPQLNISAFAAHIGINKSLMAKYIYGIKKPGEQRKKQIEEALHALGSQLMRVSL